MKKIVIPAILAAIILVAAGFAVMPVQKASTVHTTIQATTNKLRSMDTIVLSAATIIAATDDKFVLMDLHNQVATDGGFVVIQINGTAITVANLKLVAIDATGAVLGTAASFTDLGTQAAFGPAAPITQILHAHIPSASGTVLIALDAVTADVTLPKGTIITTTIDTMT